MSCLYNTFYCLEEQRVTVTGISINRSRAFALFFLCCQKIKSSLWGERKAPSCARLLMESLPRESLYLDSRAEKEAGLGGASDQLSQLGQDESFLGWRHIQS